MNTHSSNTPVQGKDPPDIKAVQCAGRKGQLGIGQECCLDGAFEVWERWGLVAYSFQFALTAPNYELKWLSFTSNICSLELRANSSLSLPTKLREIADAHG